MKATLPLFLIATTLIVYACDREHAELPDPVLSSYSDLQCKFTDPEKGESPGSDQTCVSWTYNEEQTLLMTHFNSGFNCCPEAIITTMTVSNDTIYIIERDAEQLCRCNCLYDVDLEITDLPVGKYVIRFDEPFVTGPKQPLSFELDLKKQPEGKICQSRDYYPWSGGDL